MVNPSSSSLLFRATATATVRTPKVVLHQASVVVIGGGLAGLAATLRLSEWFAKQPPTTTAANDDNDNHYSDVLLVEASHRLGGRVHSILPWKKTVTTTAPVFDMGATWFHGTKGNVAYDLAVANGMIHSHDRIEDFPKEEAKDSRNDDIDYGIELFSNDGVYITKLGERQILPAKEGVRMARFYAQALQTTNAAADTDSCWDHIKSLCGYDVPPDERNKHEQDMTWSRNRAILRSRDRFECCVVGCEGESTVDVSLTQDGYEWLPGDHVMPSHTSGPAGNWGMEGLVHILHQQIQQAAANQMRNRTIPTARILYKTPVNHINWSLSSAQGDRLIELRTINLHDPSSQPQHTATSIIRASHVIWTPSINVTKRAIENHVFSPPLPSSKVQALQRRGQGFVEKVFVILAQPLHNVRASVPLPVAWEEEGCPSSSSSDSTESTRHWKTSIYALTYEPNYQNSGQCVVSFWLSGSAGPYLNQISESLRKQEVETVLSLLYAQVVPVSEVVLSNWSGDPFVLGSYSYAKKALSSSLQPINSVEVLAEPLPSPENPFLCFAGEGTHPKYYSTMHGAIESGNREADRCIAYLQEGAKTAM
jgi:hypothetical protein